MKDQYVGDINDFEKYAVLRALQNACGLPLVVCWMLTESDESGEGARTDYLWQPERYRDLDPLVFDRLAKITHGGERKVQAVEEAGILEGASFYRHPLGDEVWSRRNFFEGLWQTVTQPSLIFFDPDRGLAPNNVRKGANGSARYVFQDELVDAFRRGHSLVVYQHFPREKREPYLARLFREVRRRLETRGDDAVRPSPSGSWQHVLRAPAAGPACPGRRQPGP
jgi:hypothetical protein